ncbi:hypothetical protein Y032_0049g1760 [Ancylostoma ceylanicum]|uniref:Uncharacterized protein n=1 Tax=Ancylostoma ceylanicum TaxID=53326 RepID=A0A016U9D3_9BILA|nr:hypothetical protein Y032_0049g1760 [Ancylostoma ceylanicum]
MNASRTFTFLPPCECECECEWVKEIKITSSREISEKSNIRNMAAAAKMQYTPHDDVEANTNTGSDQRHVGFDAYNGIFSFAATELLLYLLT